MARAGLFMRRAAGLLCANAAACQAAFLFRARRRQPGPVLLRAQDPAGDQYYAWTHALAKVAIRTAAGLPQPVRFVSEAVFHNGTELMHRLVHPFLKQGVKSDHRIAAAYGNAMGRAIADLVVR